MWYERNFEPRTGVDVCQASYRSINLRGFTRHVGIWGWRQITPFLSTQRENGLNVNLFLTFV